METGPIILAQSAAGPIYEAMLDATRPAHLAFCENNRVELRQFRVVMRGFHPWQACYNRILILRGLLDQGFRGWFMHLDADAVIRHPEFDIRRYFGKRQDNSLIACLGSPDAESWAINDGVFFLNMGNETAREIVRRWHSAFMVHLSDDMLRSASVPWRHPDGSPFPGDQHLLQMELLRDPSLMDDMLIEEPLLMNHRGAKFIRQFLRSHGSHEERLGWIKEAVSGFAC